MTVEKPVIHGRDHLHGGPDPAMVAYEDVGGSGGGSGSGDPWARFATFQATSVVSAAGGLCFSWDASPAATYDPDGEVASRDPSLAYVVNLLSAGVFRLEAEFYFQGSSTGAHSIYVGWNGSAAFLSPGPVVVPFMVDPSDSSAALAAGPGNMVARVSAAPKTVYIQPIAIPAGGRQCTLTVEKVGP